MHSLTYTAAAVFILGWVGYSLYSYGQARYKKNPQSSELPGPRLLPFIGRIHDLPIQYMWLKFYEWSGIYGPIYKTEMIGTKFVIVSDEKIAEELLVKRAKYNSDRPRMMSVTDSKSTEGGKEYLPLMGRNQYWARQRKFVHSYLTEASNAHYYGVLNHEAKRWIYRLLTEPDNFYESLEDSAAKVMAQLTWDDPSVSYTLADHAWKLLTQMSPAGPITNLITPLWDLPLMINPWKQSENKRRAAQSGWWMSQYQHTKVLHQKGEARRSWTQQYLEIEKNHPLDDDQEASAAIGMLATVGIFTVAGPLHYFLVSMVTHPEWQVKCQKEIDEVCKGQLPTMDDSPNLPTLRACIKETMRWRPNVPTGVAHETEEDDFYDGMFIAKNTRILPLDWAFLRNPEKYPDPENFRPERWLEPEWPTYQSPLTEYPTIRGMSSFGFGRRQCLGQTLTQDETIVSCGALMWAFNLRPKKDSSGQDIPIPTSVSNSLLIIKPDPYEMAFEPRSAQRKQDVIDAWMETKGRDDQERSDFLRLATEKRKEVMGWSEKTEV